MVWIHPMTLAVMTSLMTSLDARSDGADPFACSNMVPQHDSRQRTDAPPYSIQVSNTTYTPGVPITVTISADVGDSFKGFLIQARVSELGTHFDKPVGYFIPVSGTKSICNWNVGLTHTNADPKTSLTFDWMPPDTLYGKIQFRTTYVQSYYSYWVAQLSDVLYEGQTTTSTTTTPASTTSSSSTSPPTSPTTPQSVTETSTGGDVISSTTPAVTGTTSNTTQPEVGDGGGASSVTSSCVHLVTCLLLHYLSR